MAYACPVCAEPQVDGEHLANHLAFTAITGDDDHEAWLDATVPEWGEMGEATLAEAVVEHAEETEFPVDVDDADLAGPDAAQKDHGHGSGRDHDHPPGETGAAPPGAGEATTPPDEAVEDVLAEARELTERMQGDDSDEAQAVDEADGTGDTDGDGDADRSDNETQ